MASDGEHETRQERRERKLQSRRSRMQKHGARLAELYRNAVLKRAGRRGQSRGNH
ncbi:MAG TPA: hypothetical protein VFA70_10840 [Dehalococcoidia bacterium]|jgi:uncharacterized protein YciI|nr:hypothetical protein [Dehalococcoidia bacterium]